MTNRFRIKLIILFSLISLCAFVARAQEQKVALKDLPPTVQATVREQSKGAQIGGLEKEVVNGKTFYRVEVKSGGREREILIDTDGKVVEIEEEVALKDLPPPVQTTVQEQSKGAQIRGFSKEIENEKTFYEVELRVSGRTKDVLMDAEGKVVEVEEQVALNALPAAVRAEIQKQAGKDKILIVESVTKGGTLAYYEAHFKVTGGEREVKVSPEGKIVQ